MSEYTVEAETVNSYIDLVLTKYLKKDSSTIKMSSINSLCVNNYRLAKKISDCQIAKEKVEELNQDSEYASIKEKAINDCQGEFLKAHGVFNGKLIGLNISASTDEVITCLKNSGI